ncbi:MAG: hypothetical protein IJ132_00475 [Firmicutes bacterium]|nr:hypothetical protein [Bacillota bacterium]
MMKKVLVMMLALCLMVIGVGCSGSGFSDTISSIKELEPKATVKEGMALSDSDVLDSEKEVKDWAKAN